ncbi:tetratricopeptide repeat protein [Bartonella sp. DGB2]|uniref:tetratricopeptide repeat protein n=1 Tax=Bartonella sp. DGB2 TaxID=3388426 RepID=UPI00398F919B
MVLGVVISFLWAGDYGWSAVDETPFQIFREGVLAYKSGHKDVALKALRDASDLGHIGASWKLGHMYATGDGVPQNAYEAYQFFIRIIRNAVDPDSEDASYFSDALFEVARYMQRGIPDSPIKENPARALKLYFQAAISYGNSRAQRQLGLMLLRGEGGKKNPTQAARWLQLAAKKGDTVAQAIFGNMLFQTGKTVRGLAFMTAAFEQADEEDQTWIRPLQERAFAIADEAERRNAVALVDSYVKMR